MRRAARCRLRWPCRGRGRGSAAGALHRTAGGAWRGGRDPWRRLYVARRLSGGAPRGLAASRCCRERRDPRRGSPPPRAPRSAQELAGGRTSRVELQQGRDRVPRPGDWMTATTVVGGLPHPGLGAHCLVQGADGGGLDSGAVHRVDDDPGEIGGEASELPQGGLEARQGSARPVGRVDPTGPGRHELAERMRPLHHEDRVAAPADEGGDAVLQERLGAPAGPSFHKAHPGRGPGREEHPGDRALAPARSHRGRLRRTRPWPAQRPGPGTRGSAGRRRRAPPRCPRPSRPGPPGRGTRSCRGA